jgi:hypothetical protein
MNKLVGILAALLVMSDQKNKSVAVGQQLDERREARPESEVPAETPEASTGRAGSTLEQDAAPEGDEPQHGFWEDRNYCWIVLCKNNWFHLRENSLYRHHIPLGETDGVSPLPVLTGPFHARCDRCGREYRYKPSEVLRYEEELPKAFRPHPLFG